MSALREATGGTKIAPCLWFNGEAEAAAKFYTSLLPDSRIDHVQRNVNDTPSGPEGSVLVVEFTLAGQRFQALNGGMSVPFNQALSLSIDCKDQAEVDRLWDGLCDGGAPVQCGWLTDRYGVSWQIVPSVLLRMIADPDVVRARRVMEAMMQMVKLDIATLQRAYDRTS
jgi:predicted 3-demethylubiquinone-9 3-methyltransferase (glyoxalase superfamily)